MVSGVTPSPRRPLWLLPNLLSLDAPLVAVAWLYMLAKTWGVNYHPEHEYVVLGLVVWVLYVTDRLLDAAVLGDSPRCQERHRFHRRHWRKFVGGAVVAVTVALLAGKAALLALLARLFRHPLWEAARLGIVLSQGGEFAFVLFGMAAASGLIAGPLAQVLLAAVGLSLVLMPLPML